MPKNQLFKVNPDQTILNQLLGVFGLEDICDQRTFSRDYLIKEGVVSKVEDMRDDLKYYYLPCKQKLLSNLSEKRCITILRQFIKPSGYRCLGIEKSINGKKTMVYQLLEIEREQLSPKASEKREYILTFD